MAHFFQNIRLYYEILGYEKNISGRFEKKIHCTRLRNRLR
jgi:hypothetical protein